ncbi:MAG: helix-turn-helix transcriptional regulator [Clostridia bacterium]|nr:helix-turn-helix transcriptional regulator [Clostridia bacterium]
MERNSQDLGLVVGANLKRLIKDSKYRTQEEFAFEFGVDDRTVRRWISKGVYDIRVIQQIAYFFEIDVFDILSE